MADKRLLGVFAHPDDESFGPGGTMARYAAEGEVHLLCGTRGEVGEVDEHLLEGYASIADLRTRELECAVQHLGVQHLDYLGYRDSGMHGSETSRHPACLAQANVAEVAAKIVAEIRCFKPQVIVTFDQFGGYGHPDHIAIHQATVMAFKAAGDPSQYPDAGEPYQPQKLYYHSFPKTLLRGMVWVMPLFGKDPSKFGRNGDIDMREIASWDVPTTARIDIRPWYAERTAAAACHASQGGGVGLWRGVPRSVQRRLLGYETFFRAAPTFPKGAPLEKDLFAGVFLGERVKQDVRG
ncbi:MAG: PIG-L family deacetylase [Anaerolineae bacterium]